MRHAGRPKSPTSRPSTPRWHLSKQGHVVIDCPKMAEALWPAAFQPPRALAAAPEPSPVEQTGGVGGAVVAAIALSNLARLLLQRQQAQLAPYVSIYLAVSPYPYLHPNPNPIPNTSRRS